MKTSRRLVLISCTFLLLCGVVPTTWADDGSAAEVVIEILEELLGPLIEPAGNEGDCDDTTC